MRPSQRLVRGVCAVAFWAAAAGPSRTAQTGNDSDRPQPVRINKPLLAAWSFDESFGGTCRDTSGNKRDAVPERTPPAALERVDGLFGKAVRLTGHHMLRVSDQPAFGELTKISFSVWAAPSDLSGYRELFRKEDGENRILFSFQEDGKILSLGLNVGGYVECDAPIDPARVLDGGWHHGAATFDGEAFRVYLDGKQVGELKRPGAITSGGAAPPCIGSTNGGECFQGLMDDLRIYADALTAQEIALLYRGGIQSVEQSNRELDKVVRAIYMPGKTFAETLAGTRKNILEKGIKLNRDLAGLVMTRLHARFPKDCEDFTTWTGTNPLDYLATDNADILMNRTARLADLLLEYKPLTERQWKKQTPEELRKWKEADALVMRLESLKAKGDAARFLPEWIDLCLQMGQRIQFRPVKHEPVAPYVAPSTPLTRRLSAAEGRDALERDWLHQADGKPTPDRIKQEIRWTRRLAERLTTQHQARVGFAPELAALAELESTMSSDAGGARASYPPASVSGSTTTPSISARGTPAPQSDLYFKVREIKRRIMFRNPVVDFDKVLLVDMPYPQGSEWQHETRHRLGYMAVPGGRLLILGGLSPDGKPTQLMPQHPLHGTFWRPDLSFDGKRVVFCFKPHNEKSFHLYEIRVDGTGLVQLTDGPYDDLDPIYLPDGHILFSTTRAHTYVRCMPPTNAYVLARCDADGKNIYFVSTNNEPDYLPSVMNDGRVIYTRWEYTDKPLWRAQKLWTMNPDGTGLYMYWGNQSVWPDLMKDARSIPGSRRVMFTGSAHHNWFSGSVGIIDPHRGYNFPNGITKVTADVPWPECGNGPTDPIESPNYHRSGHYPAYYSPYPLSEQDFIVSADRGGKFLLYLMDVDGNRELIYEGANNVFHAQPLKARPTPPIIPDRVVWPRREERQTPKDGIIYSANVYYGAPEELKGMARYLRVLHIDPKTYTYWYKRPYISTGPVVSAVQSEGVKRILGTVPIEADGSVAFFAPAGKSLHFQLLDENYRALQTMRSFAGVMPGESRGCLGCHELHSRTPQNAPRGIAMTSEPRRITPPPWDHDTVSYGRYVQPVLDKYCGKCHQGQGQARKTLDLTERPGFLDFTEPYLTLIGRPSWGAPYVRPPNPPPGFGIANMIMVEAYSTVDPAAYRTPKPMTQLSYRSPLIERASSGNHHGVKVDGVSLQRLIAWVDAMCPFLGDEEIRQIPDPIFQGVDWLAIRPRIATAPRVPRPGPVD